MFAVKETFKQTIKHPLIYRQISQENLQRVNKTCIIQVLQEELVLF